MPGKEEISGIIERESRSRLHHGGRDLPKPAQHEWNFLIISPNFLVFFPQVDLGKWLDEFSRSLPGMSLQRVMNRFEQQFSAGVPLASSQVDSRKIFLFFLF